MRRNIKITPKKYDRGEKKTEYTQRSMFWPRAAIFFFGKVKKLYQKPRIRHTSTQQAHTVKLRYKKNQKNNIFSNLYASVVNKRARLYF